jgi:cytoskeleton protein RodZ
VEEKETLGKYLKSQRESKKISLNEVAKNTRVREPILRALEEDQHHLLPPATYVKGFLLAYAKYLGLDLNDILLRYERVLKGESIAPPSMPSPEPEQENLPPQTLRPKQKPRWRDTKQIWVVAGVIVASLVLFYLFSPYPSRVPMESSLEKRAEEKSFIPPSPPIATSRPAPEVKPPVQEKSPLTPSAPVTAAPPVQEKKAISLELKAIEETWLSLQADDQSGKEMIFKPGEGTTFQASGRILMRLGNAGGLDLTLNGKPLGKFGKSGEVLNLIITPQGVEVKRPERPKPPDEGISKSESQSSN